MGKQEKGKTQGHKDTEADTEQVIPARNWSAEIKALAENYIQHIPTAMRQKSRYKGTTTSGQEARQLTKMT